MSTISSSSAVERPLIDPLSIPLHVNRPFNQVEPVRFGVPIKRGLLSRPPSSVRISDGEARVECQASTLGYWPDGSVKWMQVDCVVPASIREGDWRLECLPPEHGGTDNSSQHADNQGFLQLSENASVNLISNVLFRDSSWRLTTEAKNLIPAMAVPEVTLQGQVCVKVVQRGRFRELPGLELHHEWTIYPDHELVRCDATIRNSRRARHSGGMWDLGDPGAHWFQALSFEVPLSSSEAAEVWLDNQQSEPTATDGAVFITQYSSGGENWKSRNHLNRYGKVCTSVPGFQARLGDLEITGERAQPTLITRGGEKKLAVCLKDFWQNFPSRISTDHTSLKVDLFPDETTGPHELQGGEQKTHTFWLHWQSNTETRESNENPFAWVEQPTIISPANVAFETAELTPVWHVNGDLGSGGFERIMHEGLDRVFALRESHDEYGWRNFGDTVADHEAVFYSEAHEFVSHYNNQFDVLLGFLYQYLRTRDRRWFSLADALAQHVIDIDVYHTKEDRSVYNGGLFWFTDHYLTAHTCTHRTFSKHNKKSGQDYGGGPGPEHNYTEGLLLYHQLTGSQQALETVIGLADWVVAMEDGSQTVFRFLDDGLTGKATVGYSKPSRGGANSINVLMDGWTVTGKDVYLNLAETLIRRCIHPKDDVGSFEFLNAERNWSYTMFLTSLDKYLKAKEVAGSIDKMYHYARLSLVSFARWMETNERSYLDHKEDLEYPTEAWPAQELRKANVLRRAARYVEGSEACRFRERATELADRAWSDLMSFENSRATIRSMALVMTEGLWDCLYRQRPCAPTNVPCQSFRFDAREVFVPQKQRVMQLAKSPQRWIGSVGQIVRKNAWMKRS